MQSGNKILQIITRSDWGGAPQVVLSLAKHSEGEVHVACGPGGKLIEELHRADIPVHVQPNLKSPPALDDVRAYYDLKQLIETHDFDLVHCHSTKAGALGRLAADQLGVDSVFTVHGWGFYNTEHRLLRPLVAMGEKMLAGKTEAIVCVSRNDFMEAKKKGIPVDGNGTVIHNGIPPINFKDNRNTVYSQFDIDPSRPVIGAIARLAPQKDPIEMLRIVKQLQNRGRKFATVLIGTGPYMNKCQSFVEDHNLTEVYLPGFREDALELLQDMDVFLLPSRFEGFPLSVLECLHSGVPVVGYDVGGVSEAIDDGQTGYTVEHGNTEGFIKKVETILEDDTLQDKMSKQGEQIAKEKFSETEMVERYQRVYEQIL